MSEISIFSPLSDGVGKTGTFICLHSQLERLKTEGVVDFFQAVKSARIQRACLVPDAVSVLFPLCHVHVCYNLLSLSPHSPTLPFATTWWPTIWTVLRLTPTSKKLYKYSVSSTVTVRYGAANSCMCFLEQLYHLERKHYCVVARVQVSLSSLRMRKISFTRRARDLSSRPKAEYDDVSAPSAPFVRP